MDSSDLNKDNINKTGSLDDPFEQVDDIQTSPNTDTDTNLDTDADIDEKFKEISRNIEMQSLDIGTQRINIFKDINMQRDTTSRQKYNLNSNNYSEDNIEYDSNDLNTSDRTDKTDDIKTIHIVLAAVAAILFSVVVTFIACKFMEENRLGYLRTENQRLNDQIEDLKNEIKAKDLEILSLGHGVDIEEFEKLSTDNKELLDKNTKLQEDIEKLQEELETTKDELKEQQFRADMFQKYGPMWER